MIDPLDAVLRMRRLALAEARRDLAAALDQETAATAAAHAIEHEITRETEIATDPASGDATVESFAAWLPAARARARSAHAAQDHAASETARCRALIAIARANLEAAEALLAERRSAAEAEAARRAQTELDEIAQRRHGRRRSDLDA